MMPAIKTTALSKCRMAFLPDVCAGRWPPVARGRI